MHIYVVHNDATRRRIIGEYMHTYYIDTPFRKYVHTLSDSIPKQNRNTM